jgi:hypothetical protein
MFQVVTVRDMAAIYDAMRCFAIVRSGLVPAIHVLIRKGKL